MAADHLAAATTTTTTTTTTIITTTKDTQDQVVLRPKSVKARLFPFKFLKKYACFKTSKHMRDHITITTTTTTTTTTKGSTSKSPGPEGSTSTTPEPGRTLVLRTDDGPVDEKDRFYMKHFARPDDKSPYDALARFMAAKPPCFFFQPEPSGDYPPKGVRLA